MKNVAKSSLFQKSSEASVCFCLVIYKILCITSKDVRADSKMCKKLDYWSRRSKASKQSVHCWNLELSLALLWSSISSYSSFHKHQTDLFCSRFEGAPELLLLPYDGGEWWRCWSVAFYIRRVIILTTPPQSKQNGMETFLDEYSRSFQWTFLLKELLILHFQVFCWKVSLSKRRFLSLQQTHY